MQGKARENRVVVLSLSLFLLLNGAMANAGVTYYSWAPVVGSGEYQNLSTGGNQQTFTATNGSITIGYDPDNPLTTTLSFTTGGPYNLGGYDFIVQTHVYSTDISFMGQGPTAINVDLIGSPGVLGTNGMPLSLDGFANHQVNVGANSGTGGTSFIFIGSVAAVPEPSSLVLSLLGFLPIIVWGRWFKRKRSTVSNFIRTERSGISR